MTMDIVWILFALFGGIALVLAALVERSTARLARRAREQSDELRSAALVEILRLEDQVSAIERELNRPDSERKHHGQEWCIRQRIRRALRPTDEDMTDWQKRSRSLFYAHTGKARLP